MPIYGMILGMATKKRAKKEVETKEEKTFHGELISQMLTLATSGFGLVAALAWNETIQAVVKEYIQPKIPGSGLISRFIYAILITALAVFITYQLSRLSARFQSKK
jgi:hypothetical protein